VPSLFARRPELALVAVTVLWGSTFVVTKGLVGAHALPPLGYLGLRFGAAALILLALFPRSLRPSRRLVADGGLLGLGQALGLLLQVFGQCYTTASKTAFLTALATALTPLVALAYGERPSRAQAFGVVLATSGLALLTYPAGDTAWNRGDLYAAGCAIIYAFVIVETARRAPHHAAGPFSAVQTVVMAAVFLVFAVASHGALAAWPAGTEPALLALERRPLVLDGTTVALIAYMAVACTVLTFVVQTFAMARMSATHAAVVFALEPVFALALALLLYGASEWPGPRGAAGASLVLAGVLAAETGRRGQGAAARTARD
jgi:drug/metabolite transporter (DMT)-like permease